MREADINLDRRGDILTGYWSRSELLVRLQEVARSIVLVREYLEFHEDSAGSIAQVIQAQNILDELLQMNLEGCGAEVRVELNRVGNRLEYAVSETAAEHFYAYVSFLRRDIHAIWAFSRYFVDVSENVNE